MKPFKNPAALTLVLCALFLLGCSKIDSDNLQLRIFLNFPYGYELTQGAPQSLSWQIESENNEKLPPAQDKNFDPFKRPYILSVPLNVKMKSLRLKAKLSYCESRNKTCFQDDFDAVILVNELNKDFMWNVVPEE